MTALNLVSLVLRGVAVLRDSVNVELRLGTSYKAGTETPEIPFSMRHPSQGYEQENFGNPANRQVHISDVADADSGAGRSLGLAGVLRRSKPTTFVGRSTSLVNAYARRLPVLGKTYHSAIGEAWCKPASRTPPASTWGRGNR
jgi:hypothetical protein